jgi:tetratricopeptide (TPR) repeat protein
LTILGVIRLAGFVTAPAVAILAKDSPRLRMLMVLDTILALLYFTSTNRSPIIPWWPQRILTFNSSFIFVAGVVGPIFLIQRYWQKNRSGVAADRKLPWAYWAAPGLILVLLGVAQIPLFRFGDKIGTSFERCRATILRTQLSGAFLKVSNIDSLEPFYLRCVPFLLFSDPALVAKKLILFTEWHDQLRHPTRLVENWYDLGRPRLLAQFFAADGIVDVRLERSDQKTFLVPTGMLAATGTDAAQVPLRVANREGQLGYDLLAVGCLRDAIEHFETALQAKPDFAQAHHDLAVALSQSGRVTEAIDQLEATIRSNPADFAAYVQRGMLLVSVGRNGEAIEQLRAALRHSPNDATVEYYLGAALVQNGNAAEAVEHFRAAIKVNPQFFEAELNLGQLLLQTGQAAEGTVHLEAAARLRPDDTTARAALDHLRQK